MIHIRVDDSPLNSERRFGCGIGPALPEGDVYYFAGELSAERADCPGCHPSGPRALGVPASRLNGNAMRHHEDPAAWDNWVRLSNSWGYD